MSRKRRRRRRRPAPAGPVGEVTAPEETATTLTPAPPPPRLRALWLVVALAWVGLVDAGLLVGEHLTSAGLCGPGSGCAQVLSSRFARVWGVPLASFGVGHALALLGLCLAALALPGGRARRRVLRVADLLALLALLSSAGLQFVQFGVLGAFCPFCTAWALVCGAVFVALGAVPRDAADLGEARPALAAGVVVVVTVVAGGLMVRGQVADARPRGVADVASEEAADGPTTSAGRAIVPPDVGPADAAAQLLVFFEFGCPHCVEMQAHLTRLRARLGDDLAMAYRPFPIVGAPREAEEVAECARVQGRFVEIHERLFADQANRVAALDTTAALASVRDLGLDVDALQACLAAGTGQEAVDRSQDLAARLGVNGVPTLFLNGRFLLQGQTTYGQLEDLVLSKLKR